MIVTVGVHLLETFYTVLIISVLCGGLRCFVLCVWFFIVVMVAIQ